MPNPAFELDHPELTRLLRGTEPAPRDEFTVAAIYFPGFHPTPFFEAWFGFGWSEWNLLRESKPRFPGHRQPIEPLWGCFDESDPAWSVREIDAAADHGIDAWIVDWYWYSGVQIWNEALDRGLLAAPNRGRMKFGLMWANHTWLNVLPAPQAGPEPAMLPIRHSLEDLDRVMDYWCEHYFRQPNYWRIDGRPWCSFFLYSSLVEQLGGQAGAARAIERFRRRAEANGEPGLYLGCTAGSANSARAGLALGFDHTFSYNAVRSDKLPPGQPIDQYEDVMAAHATQWTALEAAGVTHWPVVTQGWDVTPRNHPFEPWPPIRWNWPHGHVVVGNTPERFGQLVYAARRFLASQKRRPKVMVLNAWNEWTEGSVLLPTKDHGWGVLEAVKAALGGK